MSETLTKEEDLKYQLETLASYETDTLDDCGCEIEVCYENSAGVEGFVTVDLIDLGSRALERIEGLEKELSKLNELMDVIGA